MEGLIRLLHERMISIYNSDDFIKKLTREYNVEGVVRPKGRPKRDESERK